MFPIVTSANEKYIDFLVVLVISLSKHLTIPIEFNIIHDGFSNQSKTLLENLSRDKLDLHFIYMPDFKDKTLFGNYLSDPHFWRLIAPHILIDKEIILYLDADTMVRKDISEIFLMSGVNKTVCACIDYLGKIETGISNWKRFNFNPNEKYFNSGVLLINTKRFVEMKIAEQIIETTKNNSHYTKACGKWEQFDQYAFNVVLYGDWIELPLNYNYGSELEFKDVAIVHFNGHGKPNSKSCTFPFKNEFYNYLTKAENFNNQAFKKNENAI